jgi:hypothetical protein
MGNQVIVILKKGKHSMDDPRGCITALEELFSTAGYIGDIEVILAEKVKGTSSTPKFRIGQMTTRGSLELYVKADDNGSRHKLYVFPPTGADLPSLDKNIRQAIKILCPDRGSLKVPLVPASKMADIAKKAKPQTNTPKLPQTMSPKKLHRVIPEVEQPILHVRREELPAPAAPTLPEPMVEKKSIKEIMDDNDIVKVLMEFICDKAENGLISRQDLLKIVEDQKLGFNPTYIKDGLRRKGLITQSKRGEFKVLYEKPKAPEPVKEQQPEPVPLKSGKSRIEVLKEVAEMADKYENTALQMDGIDNEILELKARIKKLGEKRMELAKEVSRYKEAADYMAAIEEKFAA